MAYEDLNTKFVAYTNENLTDLSPVVNEINSIKQGLERLLTTPKGHNPFNREYGSSLYSLLFENSAAITSIQMFLYMDITNWEPRIDLNPSSIEIEMIDPNTYKISCDFIVKPYNVATAISTTITRE